MADPKGFLTTRRETPPRRPVDVRIMDWREVYDRVRPGPAGAAGGAVHGLRHPVLPPGLPARQPDTGVERPGLAAKTGSEAAQRLHATNNFPEFTGRLCPAPCESACVLGIKRRIPRRSRSSRSRWRSSTGPGPRAGSARSRRTRPRARRAAGRGDRLRAGRPGRRPAAHPGRPRGHRVRAGGPPGGLLRYGIPEFKLEKRHLDRRLGQMLAEGTEFRCGVRAGVDVTAAELRSGFAAIVLAGGATVPRDLPVPGRELAGIHQAMEYLPLANRAVAAAQAAGRGGDPPSRAGHQRAGQGRGDHRRR